MFRVFFCSSCFRKRKWAELKSAPLTSRLMKKYLFSLTERWDCVPIQPTAIQCSCYTFAIQIQCAIHSLYNRYTFAIQI